MQVVGLEPTLMILKTIILPIELYLHFNLYADGGNRTRQPFDFSQILYH